MHSICKRSYLVIFSLYWHIFPSYAQDIIIHYTEATGYDHQTEYQSLGMFQRIGAAHNFQVMHDNNGHLFNKADLGRAKVVVFSNTSGNSGLNASQRAALQWFVDTLGRNLLGIHAASDTYRHSSANGGATGSWDWYAQTLGGSVQTNPNHTSQHHWGTITLLQSHPATEGISFPWIKQDEFYYWQYGFLASDIHPLLQVDRTGSQSYDAPRPIAWYRIGPQKSKVFYTSLGHAASNYTTAGTEFEQLITNALLWMITNEPLPVKLGTFKVSQADEHIALSWITLSEENSDFFEVERSDNGVQWKVIHNEKAAGYSQRERTYTFLDRAPFEGPNYYRLKLVDMDGSYGYSDIESLHFSPQPSSSVSVYPVPGTGIFHIRHNKRDTPLNLEVYNSVNKMVFRARLAASEDQLDLTILPAGFYLLKAIYPSGAQTLRLIKH
ncbi:MAG: T9SS C-terminal target domain-containing protein [Bacteroidetes bacterium]|nr:MAG: T9SS C-terminal target domain-containing protein [Bacteroidota bacterium]